MELEHSGAGARWGERGISFAPSVHKIRKFWRMLRTRGERGWSFAPSAHKFREFWRMLRPWGERGWSIAPSAHKIREFWRMLRPRGERGWSIAPSAHKIRKFWRMLRTRGERGCRSPLQRTKSGNSGECCGHGANDISRSPLHLSYLTLFHIQQPSFLIQPARIAGQLPIRSDHPVTGNY